MWILSSGQSHREQSKVKKTYWERWKWEYSPGNFSYNEGENQIKWNYDCAWLKIPRVFCLVKICPVLTREAVWWPWLRPLEDISPLWKLTRFRFLWFNRKSFFLCLPNVNGKFTPPLGTDIFLSGRKDSGSRVGQ